MNILEIPFYTELDKKLEEMWYEDVSPCDWTDFIKELDKNIIGVEEVVEGKARHVTSITFANEEHISWFLLRWS